jgi:hypothetical protein
MTRPCPYCNKNVSMVYDHLAKAFTGYCEDCHRYFYVDGKAKEKT